MTKFIDMSGKKFNSLTFIEISGRDIRGIFKWKFQCDCGNIIVKPADLVKRGLVKSCGCIKRTRKAKTKQDFVAEAKQIHGNLYDYSKVVYKRADSKVTVICTKHGDFSITPDSLLAGKGCQKCANIKRSIGNKSSKDEFLIKCDRVHGNRYEYSKVEYISAKEKVEIVCKVHGEFSQTPHAHLSGKGCPKCAKTGFNASKLASIYVLSYSDMTKIGITNRSAYKRAAQIKVSSGLDFKVIKEYKGLDGKLCRDIENLVLKQLLNNFNRVSMKFEGSTECFYDVDKSWLLNILDSHINSHKASLNSLEE